MLCVDCLDTDDTGCLGSYEVSYGLLEKRMMISLTLIKSDDLLHSVRYSVLAIFVVATSFNWGHIMVTIESISFHAYDSYALHGPYL